MALVSCLCITRGEPHLLRAVGCFLKQTHPQKELVVVAHGALPDRIERRLFELVDSEKNIRVYTQPKTHKLGALRNFSLEKANGKYICQWDDDDWHHPHRVSTQLDWVVTHGVQGCMLKQEFIHDATSNKLYLSQARIEGWESTLLCETAGAQYARFPETEKGEDSVFISRLRQFKNKLDVLENLPSLYVYTYHGNNTWGRAHFERLFAAGTSLPPDQATILLEGMRRT